MESVLTSLKSSSQLTLKDIVNVEALTPDLVAVDVSIASDGSFVETASGPAAREIKRHFDHLYGVGLSVRSPYAITAFVNQHGKQTFRVGKRELSAPGAAGQEAECRLSEAQILAKPNDPSSPPRSQQRRSRLSMHHIFSQNAIFKPAPSGVLSSNPSPTTHTTMFSRPDTASSSTLSHRKLRKTRSFGPGDQPGYQNQHFLYHQQGGVAEPGSSSSSTAFTGRGHSQSVTSADASRYTSLATLAAPSASHITYSSTTTFVSTNPSTSSNSGSGSILKNSGIPQSSMLLQQSSQPNWQSAPSSDIFAEVMKWGTSSSPRRRSFMNPSTTSLSSSTASRSYEGSAHSSSGYERSVVSGVGSNQGQRDRTFLQHPFGVGVVFDSPVRRTPLSRTKSGASGSDQGVSPTSDNSALSQGSLSGVTTPPGDPKMWSGNPQFPHRLVVGPVKMLREMQSFESTMTARQIDIEPSTTRGTPVSSSPRSPLRQRYSDLSDGYSDNPNLRRPPSAVLLRNIVPAITTEIRQVDNGLDETNEVEDVASSSIASADMDADLRPHTPIKVTAALPEDAVSSGTAEGVQNQYLASAVSESIKLDDSADECVEDTARSTPVPEIKYHDPISQPDMATALEGCQISRYTNAPDIFEVLQTYTGLPLLDRLPAGSEKKAKKRANANSAGVIGNSDDLGTEVGEGDEGDGDDSDEEDLMVETTVIRMSLTTKEETAAPRDDPRFVMWGWVDDSTKVKGEEKVEGKQKKRKTWRESIISGSEGDGQSDHFGTESSGKGSKKSRRSVGSKWSKRDKKEDKGKIVANEFGVVTGRDGDDNESQGGESSDNRAGDTSLEGRKVLIAATIERWVAQLTSEIDYDELLNFFLTYRTYVSAIDLCRVLMGRFYWTLQNAEEDEGSRAKNRRVCDERVRRIVRVRTFVAIRCWILTFWMVDFVPNQELRLLLADFLNQLNKDPLLKSHVDGLDIVKKLIKIAGECKKEYLGTILEKTAHNGFRVERSDQSTALPADRNESDLDLDFLPDVQSTLRHGYGYGYPNKHGRASHLPAGVIASNFAIGPMSTLGRVVDVASHAAGSVGPFEHAPYLRVDHQQHQGPLSRVVRTIGRLKRALNARTTSTLVSQPADTITGLPDPLGQFEVSAFEVDMSGDGSGSIRSGVEGYSTPTSLPTRVDAGLAPAMIIDTPAAVQAFITSQDPLSHVLPPLTLPPSSHPIDDSGVSQMSPTEQANIQDGPYLGSATKNDRPISVATTATTNSSNSTPAPALSPTISRGAATTDTDAVQDVPDASGAGEMQEVENDPERNGGTVEMESMADIEDFSDVNADTEAETGRPESMRSTSTDSFGVPLTASRGPPPLFANTQSPWQFDIVSIDDLDLSDTSSDKGLSAPPGLRKPIRKLPKRPLFWPRESVSSMGIISHDSMASGPSSSGMSSPTPAGLGGKVEPWQLQDLLKSLRADEEEDGGVDSALKRLEGYIDPQKQEEKLKNVNEWITTIQERMKAGDYSVDVDDPRFSHLASGEEIIEFDNAGKVSNRGSVNGSEESSTPPDTGPESTTESEPDTTSSQILHTPDRPTMSTPLLQQASSPGGPTESLRVLDSKHTHEDVGPFDVLQNRVQGFPSPVPASSTFKHQPLPRLHQSFVVHHRAELLAQHFAMIDRELFMSVRFEELVTSEWTACQEVDVLDWNQYLKDRARWKAEQRLPEKTSALAAVRARFNLMTNFVISEVVLTPPSARHLVFKKFLTIAYKSYLMHNFHALTAIVTGLNSDLVFKALGRQWNRIGRREHRMFSDFQQFISNVDGFKYMRNMIDSIAQSKPPDDSSHAASIVSGGTDSKHKSDTKPPSFCIPFIGVYLSQLHRLTKLPDLVDPTAPNLAVEADPNTGALDQPRYPDVFSTLAPLPSFTQLEPLINVHKQRQIAAVIKSLIAGQHLASHVHYEIDKKLFQKCLRLRASDMTTLHHVLTMYPD
ncbi:hypothetical protein M378DRAFT_16254 [Amanita muscaria Koide BX008]|uniref:Ras GEF n=1 Tax=Amanita muscaria (strain Koide BX008) TaxID=946122 RepID=A0A0C2WL58_AMAMK|nr:hypothetical protein M378DRAFT_16254 [Amanita muscaria Koide BX008]